MGRWGFQGAVASSPDVVARDEPPRLGRLSTRRSRSSRSRASPRSPPRTRASPAISRTAPASCAYPASHFDAGRAGIALYGLSPFGADPAADGLRPVLSWRSSLALVKQLAPGESTGYGRRFVATEPTWIGIVPVGYADGFRRGLTGTEVLVAGSRRPVSGRSRWMRFAVRLDGPLEPGTPVTLIGDGLLPRSTRPTSARSPTSSPAGSTPRPGARAETA